MSGTVTANDGTALPIGDLPVTIAYNISNLPITYTVSYRGNTYIQTLTYTGTLMTNISQWIKQ